MTLQDSKEKIDEFTAERQKFKDLMDKNKGEKLNKEDLSNDAHVVAEILSVEIKDNRSSNFDKLEVKITLADATQTFQPKRQSGRDIIFEASSNL